MTKQIKTQALARLSEESAKMPWKSVDPVVQRMINKEIKILEKINMDCINTVRKNLDKLEKSYTGVGLRKSIEQIMLDEHHSVLDGVLVGVDLEAFYRLAISDLDSFIDNPLFGSMS